MRKKQQEKHEVTELFNLHYSSFIVEYGTLCKKKLSLHNYGRAKHFVSKINNQILNSVIDIQAEAVSAVAYSGRWVFPS